MTFDIVLAGVGGQGVLSVSAVIASAALASGLDVKQSETHGMAQRGGAVSAHLRLADRPIASDLVPQGCAALVLSMEPLEGLRYLPFLRPDGLVITAAEPVRNIDDYPPVEPLLAAIRQLPRARVVDAAHLARQAGSPRAVNMVMVGAASTVLPIEAAALEHEIMRFFGRKGASVTNANLQAFRAGRHASDV
ncbi:MAG: indolepyruvate oxidoreductase subunit beta [Vicinamibacterales bacterium]